MEDGGLPRYPRRMSPEDGQRSAPDVGGCRWRVAPSRRVRASASRPASVGDVPPLHPRLGAEARSPGCSPRGAPPRRRVRSHRARDRPPPERQVPPRRTTSRRGAHQPPGVLCVGSPLLGEHHGPVAGAVGPGRGRTTSRDPPPRHHPPCGRARRGGRRDLRKPRGRSREGSGARHARPPVVEVRASAIIRDDGSMWEPTSPLQPHRSVPAEAWYCEPCTRRFADARWQHENGEFDRHVRLVDFYFPNGKKFRDVFAVAERRAGGAVVATLLRRRGNGYQDVVPAPPSAATMSMLKQAFDRIIHSYSSRGAIVDSPMAWTPANEVIFTSNLVVYGDIHYPRRYRWSPKNQRWFLAREHASRRWDTDPDGGG